jgi:hypothetical protein
MHDLLFTRPGDRFPFDHLVRVSFDPDSETFSFTRRSPEGVVAEDTARVDSASAVLDAFLAQLSAE